jgi:hypothetical protein
MFQSDNSQNFFWFFGNTTNLRNGMICDKWLRNTSFSHSADQILHVLATLITLRTEVYVKTDLCTFYTELLCYQQTWALYKIHNAYGPFHTTLYGSCWLKWPWRDRCIMGRFCCSTMPSVVTIKTGSENGVTSWPFKRWRYKRKE